MAALTAALFVSFGVGVCLGRALRRGDSPAMVVYAETAAPALRPVEDAFIPVDLNSADVEALCTLPGIGPALAQRIVDYRAENGPFRYAYQVMDVPGIGESKYQALQDKITANLQERKESP